ncbi:MAG: response regulator [Bacteroidetes bacterium]|nr:response regulator [Bacteroidota bacterium]
MKHKILMIENDSDDRYLTEEMFTAEGLDARIEFIFSADAYSFIKETSQKPHLILLDMNTQPHSFTDLLQHIRRTPGFELVPIVVLGTTSRQEEVQRSYSCGANSFIRKPDDYESTVFKIKSFINYWFQSVELPMA